ncbi:metallophosphoesterase family protein [Pelagicoccus mobilis]|uniref:Metallophosphoesterase n=1 Tax=Pelagicoccus mobilis TaxID=415221 RepID=A0A934S2F0_9BACT|nr:metallophosphoesterase [Pelagicoccus mobilis]MBK1879839.1 metallophosphoesterase [Pelagicoccus mobilis]
MKRLFGVIACSILCFAGCQHTRNGTEFSISVDEDAERTPWSHLDFRNDPDNFQFAIVSDRTGGMRPGVFPKALKRLNILEPEFVITVGDLIVAGRQHKDEAVIHEMWDEMETFVSYLDMPFFYLAGNHDNGSPEMANVWRERFGVERYYFTYKNALFLCLNAQDEETFAASIGEEQQEWAKQVLADHLDVRWTFVFIHQPVWMYEDGLEYVEGRDKPRKGREVGWKPIEDALQGRPHTVFAGHVHQYVKYETADPRTNYYSLATTGGGSKLRGRNFGEFDHATWVTMTENGPKIANLLIEGILPDDVNIEDMELFRGMVSMKGEAVKHDPLTIDLTLNFDNQLDVPLQGGLHWDLPVGGPWVVEPFPHHFSLTIGEPLEVKMRLKYTGKAKVIDRLPPLLVDFEDPLGVPYSARIAKKVDLSEYYKSNGIRIPDKK